MVNFRFHLVSLTAVFLALAAGITIGAGVVDRATVDQIESRLSDVDARRKATNEENDRLRADLARWGDFSQQFGERPVAGRLAGVTVFMIGSSGIDRGMVDALRSSIESSGALVEGQISFTGKWNVANAEDARELAGILDVAPTTPAEEVRTAGLAAVATAWAIGDGGPLVAELVDRGFLELDEASGATEAVAELPRQGSLFVVISGDGADVPSAALAEPLVARLAGADIRVLAAQPVRPPPVPPPGDGDKPPAEFVLALRADQAVANRISSVDNVDDYRGRLAAVLALADLQSGRTGHYGFGPEARVLPDAGP